LGRGCDSFNYQSLKQTNLLLLLIEMPKFDI
jgi:hypothetical protein